MDKVRIGVIGCGMIANSYHLPALERVPEAELVWACDLIRERAEETCKRFGFAKWTLDYHDILQDPDIDAVFILTKIEMHARLAMEAAEAKKSIFMQKPFAYSINEGRQIIRAVEKNGVRLVPSFMHSYMDGTIAARRAIEQGRIGAIQHIRVRNATKNPKSTAPSYGGCMMDIGCHGMNLIHTLTGADIEKVFALKLYPEETRAEAAFGERADLNGIEYVALLNYVLNSGVTVEHEVFWSQIAMTKRFEVEVYGDKGVIYLYNPHRECIAYIGSNQDGHPSEGIVWEELPCEESFFGYNQHRLFVLDVLNDTFQSKNHREGFIPLQVVEAARRSMHSGRIETVLGI